jgi:hypothetical protein
MKKIFLLTIILCLQISVNGYAFTVNFDYTYDHGSFFAAQERRDVLKHAAASYSGFTDTLTAINPDGGNTWQARVKNPSPGYDGYAFYTIDNLSIASDTLTIYVGAGSASGFPVLGQASSIEIRSASGDQQFITDLTTRGQGVTQGAGANDYGALGGSIWFNSDPDWYFGIGDEGLESGHPDFFTTAAHEIGHLLGYGTADSWENLISDDLFYGAAAVNAYGGPVPTDGHHAHWAEGVMSDYNGNPQETMMDPSTPYGERQYPTTLDMAGLYDIGWETATPVPLPPSLFLLLSGLGIIVRHLKFTPPPETSGGRRQA